MPKFVSTYIRLFFLLTIYIVLSTNSVLAQKYFQMSDEKFGRSIVQYKVFNWKSIKTNNFDISYYKGGEAISNRAAVMAETSFNDITQTLGYAPFNPVKIFIFNSKDDLSQTNLGTSLAQEYGQKLENLSQSRILISYQKSDSLMKNNLIKEITNLYLFEMMYGGSLKEATQNQLLLSIPEWFSQGICAYLAESNNSNKFEKFRTAIVESKNTKLSSLSGEKATLVGQSIWNYIGLKYGRDNISNIINLTRIVRNEESSITSSLGIPFQKFLIDWRAFYVDNTGLPTEDSKVPTKSQPIKSKLVQSDSLKNLRPDEIDTDNYVFSINNIEKFNLNKPVTNQESNKAIATNNKKGKISDGVKISHPMAYLDNLIKSSSNVGFKFDPVRNFGITGTAVFNDLLENHIFTLTGFLKPSIPLLKNYDYSLEYANLSKKLDWRIKFEKRSFNLQNINNKNSFVLSPLNQIYNDSLYYVFTNRVVFQKLSASFSYPISTNFKIDFVPCIIKTSDIEYDLQGNDVKSDYYFNPLINLVFDNTQHSSKLTELGTKIKLTIDNNVGLTNSLESFKRFNFDARHYQKITKGLVLAGRFNYGNSRGNSPKTSFLGGTENVINRTVYQNQNQIPGVIQDYRNILFYNFPGNLRGFDFARLYGNNYILTNVELRLSFADYFPQSSNGSSFLSNLILVAFDDIGTAWNGTNGPWSKQNSLNTSQIGDPTTSAFTAVVTTFKNPFLMGYGLGFRSTLFGLNFKADYAWGLQDKVQNKPLFTLSLGKGF